MKTFTLALIVILAAVFAAIHPLMRRSPVQFAHASGGPLTAAIVKPVAQ